MEELAFLDMVYRSYKEIINHGYSSILSNNELLDFIDSKETRERLYEYYKEGTNKICIELSSILLSYNPNYFENVNKKKVDTSLLNIKEISYKMMEALEEKENIDLQDEKLDAFGAHFVSEQQIWDDLYNQYFLTDDLVCLEDHNEMYNGYAEDYDAIDPAAFEEFLLEIDSLLDRDFIEVKIKNTPEFNTYDFKINYEWYRLKKLFNIENIEDEFILDEREDNENIESFLETAYERFDKQFINSKLYAEKNKGFHQFSLHYVKNI